MRREDPRSQDDQTLLDDATALHAFTAGPVNSPTPRLPMFLLREAAFSSYDQITSAGNGYRMCGSLTQTADVVLTADSGERLSSVLEAEPLPVLAAGLAAQHVRQRLERRWFDEITVESASGGFGSQNRARITGEGHQFR